MTERIQLKNKITGREFQGACCQDELICGKPPVVNNSDSDSDSDISAAETTPLVDRSVGDISLKEVNRNICCIIRQKKFPFYIPYT
jgi:hypothetical protein